MRTADFDYELPQELIAQHPAAKRDQSRLLVLQRAAGSISHRTIQDLSEYLRPGDVLVLNNSKVIKARLRGSNARTGGQFELLLLEENSINDWWVMLRPGKRGRVGTQIILHGHNEQPPVQVTITETNEEGHRRVHFEGTGNIVDLLDKLGEVPLPPYIARGPKESSLEDFDRYQTVFAGPPGSVAAPTAGLHFTEAFLDQLRSRGIHVCFVTLHVGLGTFAPVKAEIVEHHKMHEERYEIPEETARAVNEAKADGRRVVAVGTTTLRVLESAPAHVDASLPSVQPGPGKTCIFIHSPFHFQIVDALLTNFHLPRSTLLMLVSAFAAPGELRGRDVILRAYSEAIREKYRFFSYGDAMLIL